MARPTRKRGYLEHIRNFNRTHKKWSCSDNCVRCLLPYCIDDETHDKGEFWRFVVAKSPEGKKTKYKSISECARAAGMKPTYLSQVIRGVRPIPPSHEGWEFKG